MHSLSSCYLFKGLSRAQIKGLWEVANEEQMQKGHILMLEGQRAEAVFILKEGAIELMTAVKETFDLPIAILRHPGDCAGTSSLLPPHENSLSARCAEHAKILTIRRDRLEALMKEDHVLGFTIMCNLAQHYLERLKETRQEMKIHFKTLFKSINTGKTERL